jgi:hypothetical protein
MQWREEVHAYRPIVAPPPICRKTSGRGVELADAKIYPDTLPPSAVSVQGFQIVIEQFWLLRNYAILHKHL